MTDKTVLTDEQIKEAADSADYSQMVTADDYIYVLARAIEAAVLESEEVKGWRDAAELGECAMKFVDRAGDYCKEDPAEVICDQFFKAMAEIVDRHCNRKGKQS